MTQSTSETVSRLLKKLQIQIDLLQHYHPYLAETIKLFFQKTRLNFSFNDYGDIELKFTMAEGVVIRLPLQEEPQVKFDAGIRLVQTSNGCKNSGVIVQQFHRVNFLLQVFESCAKNVQGLIVVEPDLHRFIRMFIQTGLDRVIKAPWIFFCIGNLSREALLQAMEERGLSYFHPWSVIHENMDLKQGENMSVGTLIKDSLMDLHKKNRLLEREFSLSFIHGTPGSLKRLLILDSWRGYPGSLHLQMFERAFRERGIHVRRIQVDVPVDHPYEHPMYCCIKERLLRPIHEFAPDWIFSLQNHTYEYLTPEFYEQVPYPWITFVSTVWLNRPPYGDNEILFLAEDGTRSQIEKDGARHVAFLPLAADYVDPTPINPNEQTVPVSFLGSCNYPTGEAFLQFKEALKPFGNLLNVIREWVEVKTTENAFDSLWEIQNLPMLAVLPSEEMRSKTAKFIECWLGGTRRLKTVTALQRFGIKVFGPDWHLVAPKNFVEQCYGGTFRDYEKERELYRRSKINLNVHWQGNVTGPNMRYFNVPAVGGFQLTNEGPGFRNYFDHDSEIAVYHDIQSLVEKTEKYLSHDEERLEMAQKAQRRIQDEHLYEHRVDEILDELKRRFS